MGEIGARVAGGDGRVVEADRSEGIRFEPRHVGDNCVGVDAVPGLVEESGREVFAGQKALVEGGRRLDAVDEMLRHRLSRLVVVGVVS